MCAINVNEFDGKVGTNKQHDTKINPEEVLHGSIKGKATKPFQAGAIGLDPLGFWENEDIYIPPNTEINTGKLLGQIMDLSNEYIIYAMQHQIPPDDGNPHILGFPTPPWEQSNDLSKALAQYTGIQASDEKIAGLNEFFYSIMYGNAQDPNGDGIQDVKDVFTLWGGSNPGDDPLTKIQDLSKKLLDDPYNHLIQVPELGKALAEYTNTEYDLGKADRLISFFLREKSDLTGDGQIDHQDVIKFWQDLDKPEEPLKGDINEDGNIDQSDVEELSRYLGVGDMNGDGKLDGADYKALADYLADPPIIGIPEGPADLNGDAVTNEEDLALLGKVLKSGDMDDDGKVDQKDVELLSDQVNPPELYGSIGIDLDNDGKEDYFINARDTLNKVVKLYQVTHSSDGTEPSYNAVDKIPGVDLDELAKAINGKHDDDYSDDSLLKFEMDLNHDGKLDKITHSPIVFG